MTEQKYTKIMKISFICLALGYFSGIIGTYTSFIGLFVALAGEGLYLLIGISLLFSSLILLIINFVISMIITINKSYDIKNKKAAKATLICGLVPLSIYLFSFLQGLF